MIQSQFAPAHRSPDPELWRQYSLFAHYPVMTDFLDKIDQHIIVLNFNRQIVYANKTFLNEYGLEKFDDIIGQRVGEVFDCRFAWCVAGCGTSDFCRECGAVQSMLQSQLNKDDVFMECVILTKNARTIELGVTSKHINIGGEAFTVFSMADISQEKQSKAVEEIFLHDISNIASGIHSMLQLMYDDRISDKGKIQAQLTRCSENLIEELQAHRVLKSAERSSLQVKVSKCNSLDILSDAVRFVERTQAARGNILYVHHNSDEFDIETDKGLLNRVLVNMLTNALEASSFSQKVTIGCEIKDGEKIFWVHNHGFISKEIQSKLFRKTFSTKRRGSGFGTRSIRILTEAYLCGRVDFKSDELEGTVFRVYLP